ncbi:hypothetical protein [Rhizobium rhizogenes]|uniref:hypothetical protein n=1 Tax=Rhizobium rhizogenes TaxID=359 RepID=UPI00157389F9|nr:hypothetical protein [Rhizobium rhizogenes]NTH22936.1 hypothetical protein [Rhizobium rhizogenes]NTH35965.1 hypothetical protein [Rhizobium rhizogenes]
MSSITKRHVPTSQLLGEYLTFVPTPQQVDHFRADMRTLNPTLLRDTIREGVQVQALQQIPIHEQRLVIHRIYNRKVKEFSSIYPFVFAVENALRSVLADYLEERFGRLDWWVLIRNARDNGQTYAAFPNILGTAVNPSFVKAVWRVFDNMVNPQHISSVTGNNKTDEFYYCLTLGELWKIMEADWLLIRDMFAPDAALGFTFTKTLFNDTMRVIKETRNELFHSNPIKDRKKIVEACERILNGLQFHLGDYDHDLGATQYVRVPPSVARTPRHVIPAR